MNITITNKLTLSDVPGDLCQAICEKLTFTNPKYLENLKMNRWNGNTPESLKYYEILPNGDMVLPRGFGPQLCRLSNKYGIRYRFDDQRRTLPEVNFTFTGQLRPYQLDAVDDMLKRNQGTLSAATGSGKTCMALAITAERKQPTLIVVHTRELLNQWIDRIETFLGIPKAEIGIIGGGKKRIGKQITVSLVQSLYKCADKVVPHVGHVVVDECHRTPSRTFTEAVTAFDCKYMLGLSATPWRRDKLSKLIFWFIGDVHHQVDKSELENNGDILKADVVIRETDFRSSYDPTNEYSKMLSELTMDTERNKLVASDVAAQAHKGEGISLILSDRKGHCEALQNILKGYGVESELLTGDVPTKRRQEVVDRLNNGKVKVLIATGQLIGEGFDCKGLSTLFLATPVRFSGRVFQYLGRILRPAPGKDRAVVFDYVDIHVGPLVASAKARQRVYDAG